MSAPLVSPNPFSMATTETLPLVFDFTAYISPGDVLSSPSTSMVNTTPGPQAGTVITLANSPTFAGNLVTQIVGGSQLAAANSYRLEITVTLNANKVETGALQINVPF